MNLVPRNSLFDLDTLFEQNFLSHVWPHSKVDGKSIATFTPRVDVKEKKDHYEITAELPGVEKKDVVVNLQNGLLTIEATTKEESVEEEDGKVIRQERRYGRFYRSFDLGAQVQESDVHANFKNGVLHIKAPIIEAKEKETHKISIN